MKSLNFAFLLTILVVLVTFVVVSFFAVQHVNETAQINHIVFRNSRNDGKMIFIAITFFSCLFLISIIGEIFYKKHLNKNRNK